MRQKQLSSYQTGIGNEVTGNTPETRKDDSQTKRKLFTERFAAMVGMRQRKKESVITGTDKSKIFGTVPAITTESGEGGKQNTESGGSLSRTFNRIEKTTS